MDFGGHKHSVPSRLCLLPCLRASISPLWVSVPTNFCTRTQPTPLSTPAGGRGPESGPVQLIRCERSSAMRVSAEPVLPVPAAPLLGLWSRWGGR